MASMAVINLAEFKADRTPHMTGKAQCAGCGTDWEAVAPVGTHELDCPSCGAHKGFFVNTVVRGDQEWECNCGSTLFRIAKHCGPYCVNCGAAQEGWFD